MTIIEAMASALPVVTSTAPASAVVVSDGETGLLLRDPDDPHELAALLDRVLADGALRDRMGKAATIAAVPYFWDSHGDLLDSSIRHLIDGRMGATAHRQHRCRASPHIVGEADETVQRPGA